MAKPGLIQTLRQRNVTRLSLDLSRNAHQQVKGGPLQTVLIGHSAAGKSAILEWLDFNRAACDMDVFAARNKRPISADTLREMLERGRELPLFVLSNRLDLIDEVIAAREAGGFTDVNFLYLRRPKAKLFELLSFVNSDGMRHTLPPAANYSRLHQGFERKYLQLADSEIDYAGASIEELAFVFGQIFRRPPIDAPRPAEKGPPPNVLGDDPEFFHEYFKVLGEAPAFPIIGAEEMRAITAGGYQVFDARKFPPPPDAASICGKKLGDLKWRDDEFTGKSVVEIGCQLGFFTFTALAYGAREAVGFDLNKRFVAEANRIAANYKTNICNWNANRAKFVTKRFDPGDMLPFVPDVLVAHSIVHWWVIQNPGMHLEEIMRWLKTACGEAVYFEGCVTAEEEIMKQNNVAMDRYNERLFLQVCGRLFSKVDYIGRCSYNPRRIVAKLFK
jgi:SAM-dependent methyltransferase